MPHMPFSMAEGFLAAALAGCLKAAENLGIQMVGFAGTSAGSFVALLSAVGYSPDELRAIMVDEVNFNEFLDDGGRRLDSLKSLLDWRCITKLHRIYGCLHILKKEHGLYNGLNLKRFLERKIRLKLPQLTDGDFRFHRLDMLGCLPLKVIATDIGRQKPCVFGSNFPSEIDDSVIDAVRASVGYPFVFRPVRVHDRRLVDGGLCSNLPIFAFAQASERSRTPIIAFDLIPGSDNPYREPYRLSQYCMDMINTSLESTDFLLRERIPGVIRVPVPIPSSFNTLDFSISREDRQNLYNIGVKSTFEHFASTLPYWRQASSDVERLQSMRNVEPDRVQELLSIIASDIASRCSVQNIRCAVMLPTDRGSRIVVYQFNMDNSPDVDLEIPIDAGCTGQSWTRRASFIADLDEARQSPESWGLTHAQHNKVPASQKPLISLPLFDLSSNAGLRSGNENQGVDVAKIDVIGTLSLDSSTPLADTSWIRDGKVRKDLVERLKLWADVVSSFIG